MHNVSMCILICTMSAHCMHSVNTCIHNIWCIAFTMSVHDDAIMRICMHAACMQIHVYACTDIVHACKFMCMHALTLCMHAACMCMHAQCKCMHANSSACMQAFMQIPLHACSMHAACMHNLVKVIIKLMLKVPIGNIIDLKLPCKLLYL